MTSQHTPGPWTFTDDPEYNCFYVDAQNGAIGVADVVRLPVKDQGLANARLIAAAPDLLDALQDLLWAVTGFGDFEAQYPEEYAKARIAIAKARGE